MAALGEGSLGTASPEHARSPGPALGASPHIRQKGDTPLRDDVQRQRIGPSPAAHAARSLSAAMAEPVMMEEDEPPRDEMMVDAPAAARGALGSPSSSGVPSPLLTDQAAADAVAAAPAGQAADVARAFLAPAPPARQQLGMRSYFSPVAAAPALPTAPAPPQPAPPQPACPMPAGPANAPPPRDYVRPPPPPRVFGPNGEDQGLARRNSDFVHTVRAGTRQI